MERFTFIDYHQTRDFSRKVSVTFEFVSQNFKGLGKSILFIAGPPVLLASLLVGSFFKDVMGASLNAGQASGPAAMAAIFMSPAFWLQIFLMFVFLIVSTVATIATVYNYLILYEEKQSNKIEVSDVWTRVRATFGMYLGTGVLFTILAIFVYIVMIIPIAILGAISPYLVGLGLFAFFVGIVYFMVTTSMVFVIRAYEKIGFFESIARSFRLVQGKWWSTFGLIVVLYVISYLISLIFMVPWYIITLVTSLHSVGVDGIEEPGSGMQIASLVFLTLYYLAQMVLYALPNIGIAFQYFNLVERKEAKGLMSQIDSLGSAPAAATPADEHY